MKVGILVGTRPEIVKMAPVLRACARRGVRRVLVHTGQHYSYELDGIFFEELGVPEPDHNLRVGPGSPPEQIARMIARLEPVLRAERPDVLLVQGDTNSVLAGALAAQKLGIAVGHVEAGLRSYDRRMPEEVNRVVADHLSDFLFAPTAGARRILLGEGIARERIVVTGNTVVDEVLRQRRRARARAALARFGVDARRFAVATVHRPENTDDPRRLAAIFEGLAAVARRHELPVIAPLHPRTRARLAGRRRLDPRILAVEALGYLEFQGLVAQSALVLTDSGGLQEEACVLGVPCVTLRESTERPESLEVGASVLAGASPRRIAAAAARMLASRRRWRNPFGDGGAGLRIVDWLRARARCRRR